MKLLIFSDIHIHPHKKSVERLEDCINALDWVFKTACSKNIKDIVFLGDLFHDRQKIDVLTYQKTFEVLEKYLLNNKINLYLLLGNHDLWHNQKWDVSSVNPLRNLPGVVVINEPTVRAISEDCLFGFLPYTHDPIEDLKKIEKYWEQECLKRKIDPPKIMGAHIAVDGAVWNVKYNTRAEVSIEHDGDMVKVGPNIFNEWNKVFLGHYHAEQKLSDVVEYVGSPLQLSFGEAFQDKHIIIYDIEKNSCEYVTNDFSPKHYIVGEDELENYELEGNFVRLEVKDITSTSMAEIRKNLVENKKVASMEITQNVIKEQHVITDAKSILHNEEDMIEKYIEQVSLDLNKDKLVTIGKKIISSSNE
jgi:DNA repair exonuclease SbcCD nuclease subunit